MPVREHPLQAALDHASAEGPAHRSQRRRVHHLVLQHGGGGRLGPHAVGVHPAREGARTPARPGRASPRCTSCAAPRTSGGRAPRGCAPPPGSPSRMPSPLRSSTSTESHGGRQPLERPFPGVPGEQLLGWHWHPAARVEHQRLAHDPSRPRQCRPRMLTPELLNRAVEILRQGGVVALPTETVYGLAANAEDELAVRRVFAIKGRPATHPLIVHLPGVEALPEWVRTIPDEARRLADGLLARSPHPGAAAHGSRHGRRHRRPGHRRRCVCPPTPWRWPCSERSEADWPRPAPTASAASAPPPPSTCARISAATWTSSSTEAPARWASSPPSWISAPAPPAILRPGGLATEELERVLGLPRPDTHRVQPCASPVLWPPTTRREWAWCSWSPPRPSPAPRRCASRGCRWACSARPASRCRGTSCASTSPRIRPASRALLYLRLREADVAGLDVLVACLPPAQGLGLAVRDRLSRAAAPRPPNA